MDPKFFSVNTQVTSTERSHQVFINPAYIVRVAQETGAAVIVMVDGGTIRVPGSAAEIIRLAKSAT